MSQDAEDAGDPKAIREASRPATHASDAFVLFADVVRLRDTSAAGHFTPPSLIIPLVRKVVAAPRAPPDKKGTLAQVANKHMSHVLAPTSSSSSSTSLWAKTGAFAFDMAPPARTRSRPITRWWSAKAMAKRQEWI